MQRKPITLEELFSWSPSRITIHWMRKIRFKRWDNVSLYRLVKLFIKNLQEDEILNRANSVAYSFMLAIFPAIIFLFTLIPYITTWIPSVNTDTLMQFLSEMMPASMYDVVNTTIRDILSNQRGGLLTLGFVFSLWRATNGMMSLMSAFNACYKTRDRRKGWKMRLVATGLTINLAIVICLAVVLLVVGVDTHGTGQVEASRIEKAVAEVMDLTPRSIRTHLDLNRPVYQRTAAYGHFGRAPDANGGFSWERTDLVEALKKAV